MAEMQEATQEFCRARTGKVRVHITCCALSMTQLHRKGASARLHVLVFSFL